MSDGVDTTGAAGKLTFTLRSLMSDMFLDELRQKTQRGLEGRFLEGHSTGGLAFGYRSTPVHDAIGNVLGHAIEVDEPYAEVVRRIFRLYLDGFAPAGIAKLLNDEGVTPPRGKKAYRRKGWIASTVREMLRNERYVGVWRFNQRKWVKVPGTNKRRPRSRPQEEHMRVERPELRIIDGDTWDAVQARIKAVRDKYRKGGNTKPKGASASGITRYPLSGLLRCGECGAPMTIYGGSNGRRYRCGDNVKRGTCKNRLSVKEAVARQRILGELRHRFTSPWGVLYTRKLVAERLGEESCRIEAELDERRERLARTQERIARLVQVIADGHDAASLVKGLRDLEAQQTEDERAVEELQAQAKAPIELPSPAEIADLLGRIEQLVEEDPVRGRETLRAFFQHGSIDLHPQPDGVYLARAELLPLAMLLTETPPGSAGGRPVYSYGCGGQI